MHGHHGGTRLGRAVFQAVESVGLTQQLGPGVFLLLFFSISPFTLSLSLTYVFLPGTADSASSNDVATCALSELIDVKYGTSRQPEDQQHCMYVLILLSSHDPSYRLLLVPPFSP